MGQKLEGKQFTTEEAIEFAESSKWKKMTHKRRARLVLTQKYLCIPPIEARESVEKALDRAVYTHEFIGMDLLLDELDGKRKAPSLQEIFEQIPTEKRVIVKGD